MICPYCSFKNSPTAIICNQCGIVLRLGKTNRLVPQASAGGGGLTFYARPAAGKPGQRTAWPPCKRAWLNWLTETQERAEADLKIPERAPTARLVLGALFLLQGEVEKSVQLVPAGAADRQRVDAEFRNNAGVALVRRGALPQAMEMLEQAKRLNPSAIAPIGKSGSPVFGDWTADPDPAASPQALAEIQRALMLEPKNPDSLQSPRPDLLPRGAL